MSESEQLPKQIEEARGEKRPFANTPLETAGKVANQLAGKTIFQRYLSQKSENTIKRQSRDLELFAEYLLDVGIMPEHGADFQTNSQAWRGVTWGIVEGFIQWQLRENYAISSVNARLSTIKVYANMATKAGAIERQEGMLIQSVRGFSRQDGLNVDLQREQTRKQAITYAYRPEKRKKTVVVTRHSTKKAEPTLLTETAVQQLKQPQNGSPQAWRDALLACLLLDHGLRAGEAALLKASDIDLESGTMTFFRPKVKGSRHEWTTHQLTEETHRVSSYYMKTFYPPTLLPDGPLILGSTRLLKDGSGGQLRHKGLNRVRLSERMAWLGKQMGIEKLSAHDCRHTCATNMTRMGYGVDALMAWFGWSSANTAVRYISATKVQKRNKG